VTFLVAASGLGKSVACRRKLVAHVKAGGFGIVLSHDVVASATTLDQAVATALRQLHPALVTMGETALSFCSPERPLLLVVEDINRSGQTHLLAEKIAGWSRAPGAGHRAGELRVRVAPNLPLVARDPRFVG
jgi:hypothetical protein